MSVGKPNDIEGDEFYVESVDVEEEMATWVIFNNATSQSSLDFTLAAPSGSEGKNLTITVVLVDAKGAKTEKVIYVAVEEKQGPGFVPDFTKFEKKKEEIKPVVIEKKTVSFEIKEPSNIGKVDIVFSDYIMMPSSVREWTSDNSGNEHLKLEYIPNTES